MKRDILEQTRRNGDELAAIKTRLDRMENKLDGLNCSVDGIAKKLGSLDRKVDNLVMSLPMILGEAVREANRERDRT